MERSLLHMSKNLKTFVESLIFLPKRFVGNKTNRQSEEVSDAGSSEERSDASFDSDQGHNKSLVGDISKKFDKISSFAKERITDLGREARDMRRRMKNLLDSNYEVGMTHLSNGDVSDAIFRFRFIRKFWPDHLPSRYQLAYCLVLKGKKTEAKIILEELLKLSPDFEDAIQLLKKISDET